MVLEANRIGSGQTGNTTAKITSQHGMVYHKLMQTIGPEGAGQYAAANQAAIRRYQDLIQSRQIRCDWEERCAYVYGNDQQMLREEAEAARELGLPASCVTDLQIPVPAVGAVKFEGQAQFHPLKFLRAMAEPLTIYEQTPVQSAEDDQLITPWGKVKAEHIVFACHIPFLNAHVR